MERGCGWGSDIYLFFLNSVSHTPAVCARAVYDPGGKSNLPFIHNVDLKKNVKILLPLHPLDVLPKNMRSC